MAPQKNAISYFTGVLFCILLLAYANDTIAQSHKVLISEFMAINDKILADEDGDYSDWIELYNPGETGINLKGWYLTDKKDNLTKWKFPDILLHPNSYLVVFASEKDRNIPGTNLHTNFKLSGSGEFLALVEPDGTTISYNFGDEFPVQRANISYGIYRGQLIFFDVPTPGSENNITNQVLTPQFSKNRGFYDSPFEVALSTADAGLPIYYTTDGTRPTKTTATLYTEPVSITTNTPLSAVTINSSGVSSEIITNTYIFIEDVLHQSATPGGYPTDWRQAGSNTPIAADYEMDPDICQSSEYKDLMGTALKTIPTMSIVTNVGYLFSAEKDAATGGIYIYTGKPSGTGVDWVRPTSVEYFDPATNKEFQINCRLKLHGGNSRNPANSPKHGFELAFKSDYGPSKLNFDLFDNEKAAKEFNSLKLRASYNYSWVLLNNANAKQRVAAQYLQDSWTKTVQLDMGNPSGHEKFVHLYINGLYWGLYNLAEDYSNDFMKSYMKGKEADFDVIKEQQFNPATYTTAKPTAGNFLAWKALVDQVQTNAISSNENYQKLLGKNPDGTINPAYSNLLDVENYIDYILINYYIGNLDWNKNNWTAARNRITNEAGFRFFCWDAETTMTALETNIVTAEKTSANPANFIQYLVLNADFKILLADKIQKHFLAPEGALTPQAAANRYSKLADEIDMAIIAESARWGDCSKTLYTKNDHWLPRKADLLDNYFPNRTDIVLNQLREAGYFPQINAPVFSQWSGAYQNKVDLEMNSTSGGEIYFTTDNSDPREVVTGNVSSVASKYLSSVALTKNITVKARTRVGNDWSALTEAEYNFDGTTNSVDFPVVTEIGNSKAYPNPFREKTKITYSLNSSGNVRVRIVGINGQLVDEIFNGYQSQGSQEVIWTPNNETKGIYIYQIATENGRFVGKIIRN